LALKKNASTYLGVYLYHPTYETRPWSVDVSTHLKLVGTGNGGNREFELKKTFHNDCTIAGVDEFIRWSDLIDETKGFINDKEQITIEARLILSNIVGI
ncbi:hypothetical protein PMAYCL1PPCAC_05436, partial [Pristionchus mayeri]